MLWVFMPLFWNILITFAQKKWVVLYLSHNYMSFFCTLTLNIIYPNEYDFNYSSLCLLFPKFITNLFLCQVLIKFYFNECIRKAIYHTKVDLKRKIIRIWNGFLKFYFWQVIYNKMLIRNSGEISLGWMDVGSNKVENS